MATGRLVLRAALGGVIAGHGLQKLRGDFGGPGLAGTEAMMGSIGMHPAKQQALAAAWSETAGGVLTAAGFLSPLGPAMIAGTMVVAIQKVHGKNGLWVTAGGYEYNLLIIAAAFSLAAQGPGPLSLDGLLRKQRSGLAWGLLSLGLAAGAAAGALVLADKMAPEPAPETAASSAVVAAEAPAGPTDTES